MSLIGSSQTRIDGRAKVTGRATYTAEFHIPDMAYAVMVQSTIAKGRITFIDTHDSEQASGVLAVMTPNNAPRLAAPEARLSLLQDDRVYYNNQPVAVIVATSFYEAQYAASLIRVDYAAEEPQLDFKAGFPASYPGSHNDEPGDMSWGNVDTGLRRAEVQIDEIYTTPMQHHNPIEPHATVAQWNGDKLTVYDSSQNVNGRRDSLAKVFGIAQDSVRVICEFVGGAFGCKGQMWSHVVLAAMAAKQTGRPIKLVLDRPQMFGPIGARPMTYQHLTIGATRGGKLTAIRHHVHAHTSFLEDYLESSAFPTRVMYACPNISTSHRLVQLNLGTPTYMRAPGVATGTYAVEVAMDELAYKLGIDPLQLRLLNYTEVDPHSKLPFTGKHLRECYMKAADRFGWSRRNHEPRSMRDGNLLVGWGMATETYPAHSLPASVLVRMKPDGRVLVACGTHEIGGGTYTTLAMVAADVLGLPIDKIDVEIGDTMLPPAGISAGSMTTSSVTPAVQAAALNVNEQLKTAAKSGESTEARVDLKPDADLAKTFSSHSFGAAFAAVTVDPQLGVVRVRRIVAVYDVGRLVDQKTAQSQFIGGIVWGVGLALHEDTHVDPHTGRIVNANLEEYHVPCSADIGEIDASALDIPDTNFNSMGVRGIGEIGITGTAAAVANAIFHATGKRVRNLPITPDKLIA